MVNCPSCGAPIDAHLDNCPYCGALLSKERKSADSSQPQVVIQQIIQEDPYAKQREQEKHERKYLANKAADIYLIVFGGIVTTIGVPLSWGGDWGFYVICFGVFCITLGISNLNKHKKEYEKNIIK